MMIVIHRLRQYSYLMRLHKPIGIFLLLWPTLWALWLAAHGQPHWQVVAIFVAGVILMRSAGCIANDYADRYVDGHVQRTRKRPLVTGEVSTKEALVLFCLLSLAAFGLVLFCNSLTILLAFVGLGLAVCYPLLKRFTYFPQVGLGFAFAWGIPMAFAAEMNIVPWSGWLLFFAGALWPVIYDTFYAMVDREEDIKVGIKSTAICFGRLDRWIIVVLQTWFLCLMWLVGHVFKLNGFYNMSLLVVALLFLYQQWLVGHRCRKYYFRAFLNNHWVGLAIFAGILVG